jgi:hypothetical protein
MNCYVGRDFCTDYIQVRMESPFSGDTYCFRCEDKMESTHPFPGKEFDAEEVENLVRWLQTLLQKSHDKPNLCQGCFKALPGRAIYENGAWIVTCELCLHEHELPVKHD